MKELNAYIKQLLESTGVTVSDSNMLTIKGTTPILMDKIPVAMPTSENLNSMNTVDYATNKVIEKHKIFNPFAEDEIKKNQHLVLLSGYMSNNASIGLLSVMQQLIMLLEDNELQDKMHTTIQKYIVTAREAIGNKGKLVSKKTLPALTKMSQYLAANGLNIVSIKSARGNTINGIKYARTAVIDDTVLELLKGNGKLDMADESIGIGDRERDLFLSMIEFILPNLNEMVAGSKSTRYPSFIALTELYNEIQTRINFLLKELKEVNPIPFEVLYVTLVEPTECEKYHKDIDFLPSPVKPVESPTNASAPIGNNSNLNNDLINNMRQSYAGATNNQYAVQQNVNQQPIQQYYNNTPMNQQPEQYYSNTSNQQQPMNQYQQQQISDDPIEQMLRQNRAENQNKSGFYNHNNSTIVSQGNTVYNQAPHESFTNRLMGNTNPINNIMSQPSGW